MARHALGPASLRIVQALDALAPGPWVVACSGGADSLALAWGAAHVAARRGTPARAVIVDHGLQPGSDAVAARVRDRLGHLPSRDGSAALALAATVVQVEVTDAGAGPEASAREARYAALVAAAEPGERVLLGHTLDDQAETVLLGLARGSGARSLAGMPPERGVFARPLLGLGREVSAACCAELGLTPWADPHNADRRFARVRVREAVLPVLERELGPGVREALARTAVQLRRDADVLDALADAEPDADELNCRRLAGLEPAVRDRIVRGWLRARGASDLATGHVDAVTALVTDWHGQKGIDVPGLRVVRKDGVLRALPR